MPISVVNIPKIVGEIERVWEAFVRCGFKKQIVLYMCLCFCVFSYIYRLFLSRSCSHKRSCYTLFMFSTGTLCAQFLVALSYIVLHIVHVLLTPAVWISLHWSVRGKAELGREWLGRHSCHHRSLETFLSRASWAPGALRLLHRHCGDSQWVNSYSPIQKVCFIWAAHMLFI